MRLTASPEFVLYPVGPSYVSAGSINDIGALAYSPFAQDAIYFFAPGDLSSTRLFGLGDSFR
jgi:hypothetical protein